MLSGRTSIRFIKPGEEDAVSALVRRVFDEFVAPDFSPEGIEEFYRYADAAAMEERRIAGEQILVAEEDQRIVGMVELRGFDHVAMLFVESPGHGVGRKLIERALQICRQREPGVEQVTVHASRYAVAIYRKLGFEAEGPERTENGITYLPMVFTFSGSKKAG